MMAKDKSEKKSAPFSICNLEVAKEMCFQIGGDPLIAATREVELNPEDDRTYYRRSQIYRDRKKYKLWFADLDRAIKLNPDNHKYHARLAELYTIWKGQINFSKARECLDKAISLYPCEKYYIQMYETYRDEKDRTSALKILDKTIELYPKSVEAYLARVSLHKNHKRWLESARNFVEATPLVEQLSEEKKCYYQLGYSFWENKDLLYLVDSLTQIEILLQTRTADNQDENIKLTKIVEDVNAKLTELGSLESLEMPAFEDKTNPEFENIKFKM